LHLVTTAFELASVAIHFDFQLISPFEGEVLTHGVSSPYRLYFYHLCHVRTADSVSVI